MSYMAGPPSPWSYAMHLRRLMLPGVPNGEKRANYNCSMQVKAILMPADKSKIGDLLRHAILLR